MKKKLLSLLMIGFCVFGTYAAGKKSVNSNTELFVNLSQKVNFIDPSMITSTSEHAVYLALFEGLVTYDPETCEPRPGLAKSWERRGEKKEIIRFHLRKTTWSDGTPITAETVVESWLYYLSPSTAAEYSYIPAWLIKGAADFNNGQGDEKDVGLKVVDPYTLDVRLSGEIPFAESLIAHFSFPVLPLHVMKRYGEFWTRPQFFVGNGPFVLEQTDGKNYITVTRNDKYWNKKKVFLSKINFLFIDDDNLSYNLFKENKIDWLTFVPADKIKEARLLKSYQVAPENANYYYIFNMNDSVLKDKRVRKALAQSIDKQKLVDDYQIFDNYATDSFVPSFPGYTPAEGNPFNVEEAKKLLAEAGYPEGKGFPEITIIYNTNENHRIIAEFIKEQWEENLGIVVKIKDIQWSSFLNLRQSNSFQIARAGWVGDYADPVNYLEMFVSGSPMNDGRYNSKEYDDLIMKSYSIENPEERNAVLQRAEEILVKDEQVIIPIYYYSSTNMIDLDKWEGWYTNVCDIHPYVGLKPKK